MPERNPRRRHPGSGGGSSRKTKPPHPSPSPRATRCRKASPSPAAPPNRNRPLSRIRNYHSGRTSRVLKRCASEPILRSNPTGDQEEEGPSDGDPLLHDRPSHSSSFTCLENYCWPEGVAAIHRPRTWTDVFSSSPSRLGSGSSPRPSFDVYSRDAKVVLNVTVEGSPGPVRTMVKLGSTVEETIGLVVDKYSEEGRTPRLGRDAEPSYELHHSHFSLQCLERSELIGEVGSRNFYMRKSGSSRRKSRSGSLLGSSPATVERNSPPPKGIPPAIVLFQGFFARKFSKIVRRTRRVWNMVVCLP
ncbi:unnamed protein product [Linum tenue]|uniref:DUF7054 domain-containing protein n=1 Tax=Linum tenue TaxID=586396 RepID=A0AAV0JVC7_9ROSI|nr:unnamed protein product [Linum tenue]